MFVVTKPNTSLRGLVTTQAVKAFQTIYQFEPQFSSTLARDCLVEGSSELERLVNYVKMKLFVSPELSGAFFDLMDHYEDFEATNPLEYDEYTKKVAYTVLINAFTMINQYREDGGWALDLQFSLINHSCNPNCSLIYNKQLQLIATRNLAPRKELTVSYVPLNMPRVIRQYRLKERFFFDCQCGYCKCAHDYYFSYNCPYCHMVVKDLSFLGLLHEDSEFGSVICKGCSRSIDLSTVGSLHRRLTRRYLLELHPRFRFDSEEVIVKQISQLQPVTVGETYWEDCKTLLLTGIVPSYCYPLNVILPNIHTTSTEIQAHITAVLTFQGCVFNRLELYYYIREFVLQIAEHGPSSLETCVVPLVNRIRGFFSDDKKLNYQLNQVQRKFKGLASTDPWGGLKRVLEEDGVAYKSKGQRLWVQMISRVFIEI